MNNSISTKVVSIFSNRSNKKITKTFNIKNYDSIESRNLAIDKFKQTIRTDNLSYKSNTTDPEESHENPGISPLNYPSHQSEIDLYIDSGGVQQMSVVVIGSGKAGKTTMMTYLFKKYFKSADMISTLFSVNSHIPLYKDFEIKIQTFNDACKKYIEVCHSININCDNKYKFNFCFDDCINMKYTKVIDNLILTYRNANMSCIICLQYLRLLSKQNRNTINNIFLLNNNSDEARTDILDTYLGGYFTKMGIIGKVNQLAFYKEMTKNYGIIYLCPAKESISFHRLKNI